MYNQQEQYNPLNTALKDKMIKNKDKIVIKLDKIILKLDKDIKNGKELYDRLINKGFKSRKEAVIVTRLLIK